MKQITINGQEVEIGPYHNGGHGAVFRMHGEEYYASCEGSLKDIINTVKFHLTEELPYQLYRIASGRWEGTVFISKLLTQDDIHGDALGDTVTFIDGYGREVMTIRTSHLSGYTRLSGLHILPNDTNVLRLKGRMGDEI